MTKLSIAAVAVALIACGGSDKKVAEPQPNPDAPVQVADVLTIAPFVLTITGVSQPNNTESVRIFRGSADGIVSIEEDGQSREVVKVSSDGSFTPLTGEDKGSGSIDREGVITINGKPLPGRVGEDGTIYRGEEAILKIEGGVVIGLLDGVMTSTIKSNGEVVSETKFEMKVEGGDEVRRLVGSLLLLQLAGGSVSTEVREATPGDPAQPPAPTTP